LNSTLVANSMLALDKRSAAPAPAAPADSTETLIVSARTGDGRSRDALVRRFLPLLRQWAHRRLPPAARDLHETEDLVQLALMRALNHLDGFRPEGPGSFLAYLRQILLNQVRDEVRRVARRPRVDDSVLEIADEGLGGAPLQRLIREERLGAYECALAKLPQRQQALVVMRLELGLSYPEIAVEVGGSPDAARVMVARALVKLAEYLKPHAG
jgi:RNA polymerase sigma factor (sigma-70 family)